MAKEVPVAKRRKKSAEAEKVPTSPAEEAWQPLVSLRQEMDRVFDDFMSGWPWRRRPFDVSPWNQISGSLGLTTPATNVVETGKEFEISLDMPGMEEKDIEVSLSDDVLTVQAERSEEREKGKGRYRLSERRFGSIERAFRLPRNVDADNIAAHYEKGVLHLTLPKTKEAQQKERKIKVEAK